MPDIFTAVSEARRTIPVGTTWVHHRGERYVVVGHCVLRGRIVPAVLYRDENGVIWCRPARHFTDGRLRPVDDVPATTAVPSPVAGR